MSTVMKKLLGVLAVTFGVAIVAWVLYNNLVERQAEYTGGFKPFGLALPMIAVGIYWLRSGGARQSPTHEGS